jgi:hypothetical protein
MPAASRAATSSLTSLRRRSVGPGVRGQPVRELLDCTIVDLDKRT